MGRQHEKARELVSKLRSEGFDVYYDESRNPSFMPMALFEVTLGIPNVMPAEAKGDVLVQLHETEGGKVSADIIRVADGRETESIHACNKWNSLMRYVRLYVIDGFFSSGPTIVADYDFEYGDYPYHESVIRALREIREVVNEAYPDLRKAAG